MLETLVSNIGYGVKELSTSTQTQCLFLNVCVCGARKNTVKKTINHLQYIGSSVQFWDGILRPG